MIFNGKDILLDMAKQAGFPTKESLVAAHTLFVHPETVKLTNNQNLFSIIRDFPNRGKILIQDEEKVMCCDNTGPQHAIEWSLGGMKKTDVQINHIYSESKNVVYYTSLANLCATPTFIAKLTDTDHEIKNLLKYRVYDLYNFFIEQRPEKPVQYDQLNWMPFESPIENLEDFLRSRMKSCPKSRTTKSAREIGWYFSNFQPDPSL